LRDGTPTTSGYATPPRSSSIENCVVTGWLNWPPRSTTRRFRGPDTHLQDKDLSQAQRAVVDAIDWQAVVQQALDTRLADPRPLRLLLRLLPVEHRVEALDLIADNLPDLLPVVDALACYFQPLDALERHRPSLGSELLELVAAARLPCDEHEAVWLLAPFATSTNRRHLAQLRVLARSSRSAFVRRQAVLGLRSIGDAATLREAKHRVRDAFDWEQQALLHACTLLSGPDVRTLAAGLGCHEPEWDGETALLKAIASNCSSLAWT